MTMSRRRVLAAGAAGTAALGLGLGGPARAADDKVIRIGFQKYGTLILLKAKGSLEERLKPLGYRVAWSEFPAGPQLLEALNVGAIDFGSTGEAPPIFAQAAGADLQYVAHEPPAPRGEAILVPKTSPLKSVAELKGKKVALNKGSNVHYLLVKALEQAEVPYDAVEKVFLAPADARAAFDGGRVDAWAIWDPFQAAAEVATGARTLVNGEGLVPNHQFYLAARKFSESHGPVVDATIAALAEIDRWIAANPQAAADQLGPATGIPASVIRVAVERQAYGIRSLSPAVVAEQQKIADAFFKLGLLAKPVVIAEVVRKPTG